MRNHWLDFLKLIGIIIVAFHHTAWTSMEHGYMPVELFFIISGFFIFQTYRKMNMGAGNYIIHKFKRIAPTYYLTLLIYILLFIVAPQFYPNASYTDLVISSLRDGACLQATGLFDLYIHNPIRLNPSDWYISSFLYGGLIVYLMLKSGKYALILLTMTATVTYSAYFLVFDTGLNDEWGYIGFMYMPLWRGTAGMAVGALCGIAMSSKWFTDFYIRNIRIHNIIATLALIGLGVSLFNPENHNFIGILLFTILFINAVAPGGLSRYFQTGVIKHIPDISLEILLVHKFLIIVTVKVAEFIGVLYVDSARYLLFIIILIAGGIALKKCTSNIESKFKLLKRSPLTIAR